VVWPFTTINSYGVAHASAQKITEITKSLKICYLFNINRSHFKVVRRRTETTRQQRVGRSESGSYWTCWWQVTSTSTVCVYAGGRHFEHML